MAPPMRAPIRDPGSGDITTRSVDRKGAAKINHRSLPEPARKAEEVVANWDECTENDLMAFIAFGYALSGIDGR